MIPEIDDIAVSSAVREGMPKDLYIPIAARSLDAITKYIGSFSKVTNSAFTVNPYNIPQRNLKLPIWEVKNCDILHEPNQLWVHVNYSSYRKAYTKAFPNINLDNLVLDHVMNRRVARLKGFEFLRIVPISRAANSSSGNYTERYSYNGHSDPKMIEYNKKNQSFIQYADAADIVKMLSINTGGKIQEGLCDVLYYFYEKQ